MCRRTQLIRKTRKKKRLRNKFKLRNYNIPNYDLLEKFTGCKRKDSVAVKAWNDLINLIMYGKTYGITSHRQKRWVIKVRNTGLCHFNAISGRWRLTQAGSQIILNFWNKKR